MIQSLTTEELSVYLSKQMNHLFPDNDEVMPGLLLPQVQTALDRLHFCFSRVSHKRYHTGTDTIYNHLYTDHNIVFYWLLSNTIWAETKNDRLASKVYYLNKAIHAFDCMFDTALPEIFLVFHGAGTMLGKAVYSDYFVVLHGCTVGSQKGHYPVMGKGVSLTANSAIIGNCQVGHRATVGAKVMVFDQDLEKDTTVFLQTETGKMVAKASAVCYAQQFFSTDLKSF